MTAFNYDNEGNLLSGLTPTSALPDRPNLNFIYNAQNRPIKVSKKDGFSWDFRMPDENQVMKEEREE